MSFTMVACEPGTGKIQMSLEGSQYKIIAQYYFYISAMVVYLFLLGNSEIFTEVL